MGLASPTSFRCRKLPAHRLTLWMLSTVLVLAAWGCSLKRIAIGSIASSLAESGDTFASDSDPELIRAAVPFSLKLVESLLAEVPEHRGLLLTACSSFTQYAYAFVDRDAELVKVADYARYVQLQDRARLLYVRARDYCLRGLELRERGLRERLAGDPGAALARLRTEDVPLLYWTAASWGKAVALSLDRPALAGDYPIVRAIAARALALDESYGNGALHEMMISVETVPEAMGGSPERARQHFERAVSLSKGLSASAYISYATGVLVPQQKRTEFVDLLNRALAIDVHAAPALRLANVLAQEQARFLLDHLDELFLSDPSEPTTAGSTRRDDNAT
jgi:predicted anti-sigma-YlaC factor YlaD